MLLCAGWLLSPQHPHSSTQAASPIGSRLHLCPHLLPLQTLTCPASPDHHDRKRTMTQAGMCNSDPYHVLTKVHSLHQCFEIRKASQSRRPVTTCAEASTRLAVQPVTGHLPTRVLAGRPSPPTSGAAWPASSAMQSPLDWTCWPQVCVSASVHASVRVGGEEGGGNVLTRTSERVFEGSLGLSRRCPLVLHLNSDREPMGCRCLWVWVRMPDQQLLATNRTCQPCLHACSCGHSSVHMLRTRCEEKA